MHNFEAIETKNDNHVGGWVTTADSIKLWVDVYGRGRPIFFVHGWTMSSVYWRRQIALSDQFQIITVDLRGHGRSQSVLRGNTVPRYARDIRDVIRALDLRDVLLAGWSLAGSVILDYWKQYGDDKLSALALIESSPYPLAEAPWNTHRYRGMDVDAVTPEIERLKSTREAFGKLFINNMFMDGHAPDHAKAWMLAEQLKANSETAIAIYLDYLKRDYTGVLPTISIPTLAIYGRSKHMCFGPSIGRYVAGSIPNSRFTILDKSGHLPFYEEPGLFNEEITHFAHNLG